MFGFEISDTMTAILAIAAGMFIVFLITWETCSMKYKEREFDLVNDAFDAGMDAVIVQLSTPELDRLAMNLKQAMVERDKRQRGFGPDIDWQMQQAVDLANDENRD